MGFPVVTLVVAVTTKVGPRSRPATRRAPATAAETLAHGEVRIIDRIDAEHPETFTEITGVRAQRRPHPPGGPTRTRFQILDLANGSSEQLGRMGKGPGEYTLSVALIALAGDRSGIADAYTIHWTDSAGRETVTGPNAFSPVPVNQFANATCGAAVLAARQSVHPRLEICRPQTLPRVCADYFESARRRYAQLKFCRALRGLL
jgi:hypothetical protein